MDVADAYTHSYRHMVDLSKEIDFRIAFSKIRKEQTGKSHPSNLAAPLTLRCEWRGSSVALRRRFSPVLPFNFLSIGSGLNQRIKHSRGSVDATYICLARGLGYSLANSQRNGNGRYHR